MHCWRESRCAGLAEQPQVISLKVDSVRLNFFTTVTLLCSLSAVHAGSHNFKPSQALPQYAQECAACHMAYPPALLSADSWQRILTGLSQHYGVDASLDVAQINTIGRWLKSEAGAYKKVQTSPPDDRISQSDWFVREHRRVPTEVWRLASVKSPSQCTACHTQADQGRFDERDLRPPTGMKGGFR